MNEWIEAQGSHKKKINNLQSMCHVSVNKLEDGRLLEPMVLAAH